LGVETVPATAGTGLAAAFAAGTAASALSAGIRPDRLMMDIHRRPGGLLRITPARSGPE